MNENDLVKILDNYMGNEGYYMKPKISDDENSFLLRKEEHMPEYCGIALLR